MPESQTVIEPVAGDEQPVADAPPPSRKALTPLVWFPFLVVGVTIERWLLVRHGLGIGTDESVYLAEANHWLGHTPPQVGIAGFRPRGPGAALYPFLAVARNPGVWHRVAFTVFAVALALALYAVGRRLIGALAAAWAAIAFSVFWVTLFESVQFLPDIVASLLVATGYVLYLRSVEEDGPVGPLWPATALIALAFYFNPIVPAAALFPPAIDFIIRRRKEILRRSTILAVIATIFVVLPYFVLVWMQHGSPFALLKQIAQIHTNQLVTMHRGYHLYIQWFFQTNFLFGRAAGLWLIAGSVLLIVALVKGWPIERRYARFLALWLVIPTVIMSVITHAEQRYLFVSYPAMFLTGALVVVAFVKAAHALPAARVAVIAIAVVAFAVLPAYATQQYRAAEGNRDRYNIGYLHRDQVAEFVASRAHAPCAVFAPYAELYYLHTSCRTFWITAATDVHDLAAGTTQTFFVLYGPREHNSGAPQAVAAFVRAHGIVVRVIPGPTPGRDATVYEAR